MKRRLSQDIVHRPVPDLVPNHDPAPIFTIPNELFSVICASGLTDVDQRMLALTCTALAHIVGPRLRCRPDRFLATAVLRGSDAQIRYCTKTMGMKPDARTVAALAATGRFGDWTDLFVDDQELSPRYLQLVDQELLALYFQQGWTKNPVEGAMRLLDWLNKLGLKTAALVTECACRTAGYYLSDTDLVVFVDEVKSRWSGFQRHAAITNGIVLGGSVSKLDVWHEFSPNNTIDCKVLLDTAKRGRTLMCLYILHMRFEQGIFGALHMYDGALASGELTVLEALYRYYPMNQLPLAYNTPENWYSLASRCPTTVSMEWLRNKGVALPSMYLFSRAIFDISRSATAWLFDNGMTLSDDLFVTISTALERSPLMRPFDVGILEEVCARGVRPSDECLFQLVCTSMVWRKFCQARPPTDEDLADAADNRILSPSLLSPQSRVTDVGGIKQTADAVLALVKKWLADGTVRLSSHLHRFRNQVTYDYWLAFVAENASLFASDQ